VLITKFEFLRIVPSNTIQIVSHNVQSIRKHIRTICNDKVFTESHILQFQEIWATADEKFEIPNTIETQRNNISGKPAARGTIIYLKFNDSIRDCPVFSFEYSNQRIDITTCIYLEDVVFINIYKNPSATFEFFKASMEEINYIFTTQNVLLCGDINDQIEKSPISNYLKNKFNLQLLSPILPTTDSGTTIDAVFG
jgi:exonuclease III